MLGKSAAVEFLGNLEGSLVLQISTPASLQIHFTITYLPFTVPPRYVTTRATTFTTVIDLVMADKLGFLEHPREIVRSMRISLTSKPKTHQQLLWMKSRLITKLG
jgi:hypothetical protein